MNAIVPLNITALRVNKNDQTNIVGKFKGRTAVFEKLPYGSTGQGSSTGDALVQPLDSNASPANPLGAGVHLHWALPDYFKRGIQPSQGGNLVFPQAPNRWLITRYLSIYDSTSQRYGDVTPKSFIVESDYVSAEIQPDAYGIRRPAVSVPLPTVPSYNEQPFMYMGRVLNYDSWDPTAENPGEYLPAFSGEDGQPLYLNSIGFVGPGFSAYYPDCCSVFGFWDHFKDTADVYEAINENLPLQFKVSYQVTGWINDQLKDPLKNISSKVAEQYNAYVSQCIQEQVEIKKTPADTFDAVSQEQFRWLFDTREITYTLNQDKTLATLNAPGSTLCSGSLQELVWNMLSNPGTSYFLKNEENISNPSLWNATVKLAAGNTVIEALSALLKDDMSQIENDPEVLTSYEYLLDALQMGLLNSIDNETDKLITLEEALHTQGFSQFNGGKLWIIEEKEQNPNQPQNPEEEVTLPLQVAELLHNLNQAQKTYDQARAALDASRKQVFMDWLHYIKGYTGEVVDPYVELNTLASFLLTNTGGEINSVINAGNQTGILFYRQDQVSGQVIALLEPSQSAPDSLAFGVWNSYQVLVNAMKDYPEWKMQCIPAPSFWMPTDPVIIMEGDKIEPVVRNTKDGSIPVRVSTELILGILLEYNGSSFSVYPNNLLNVPTITAATPMQSDVQNLVYEVYFIFPSLVNTVSTALKNKLGSGNPAVESIGDFERTLQEAQGGLSPLESDTSAGVFSLVHAKNYLPEPNAQIQLTTPMAISFTFTNGQNNGWLPNPVAWCVQQAYPELSADRYDPFLPTFMLWSVQLDPLKRNNGADYNGGNLTDYFTLNTDAIDYEYLINNNNPDFTKGINLPYDSSVILSTKSTYSLTQQIDTYIQNYPSDPNDPILESIKEIYNNRKILSQAVSGFNLEQTLRTYLPQMEVEDLTKGSRDTITLALNNAANQNGQDNWYDFGFNSQSPIATGPLSQNNFGPLRSGFMEVESLGIVDVFGQQMALSTATLNKGGSLRITPSIPLLPMSEDQANKEKIFLPPRLLTPTRLWFKWLSADFDNSVPGYSSDFVEMNSHPATSPICGWILPNHLDGLLFFYDSDGIPIGSFGIEHNSLAYRTRPGNIANQTDSLQFDIGEPGQPTVNQHTANLMWYLNGMDALFLGDLMATIENSSQYINPASYPQDNSLAVLVGRPLAITRAILSMETSGNVLPINQADTSANDPFPQDVNNNRYEYSERVKSSSAQLSTVKFPVRLGDLATINDGLVGYLPEASGSNPYSNFYSPAVVGSGNDYLQKPDSTNIQLTLNAQPLSYTLLIDPRAPVHATTGILPVMELQIPADQYQTAMNSLSMMFSIHPVLKTNPELNMPLPMQTGYNWSWISPGNGLFTPLKSNAGNEYAIYSYSPQTVLEGWIQLLADAKDPSEN
ncbi:hypothetical protein [Algoriphagus resistens]|uniref:hypothetical protein n=1 Tax=Algoriphagus resistens TaxID=1750590 RepID=UPI000716A534|nr:hypothetical protein [Algoriphagus resistens]